MIKTSFELQVPEDAAATVTIFASVAEFKRIREQLKSAQIAYDYPISELVRQIDLAISKASESFTAKEPTPK